MDILKQSSLPSHGITADDIDFDSLDERCRQRAQEVARCLTRLHEEQLARIAQEAGATERARGEQRRLAEVARQRLRQLSLRRDAEIEELSQAVRERGAVLAEAGARLAALKARLTALRQDQVGAERQLRQNQDGEASLGSGCVGATSVASRREDLQARVDSQLADRLAAETAADERQRRLEDGLAELRVARERAAELSGRLAELRGPQLAEAATVARALEAEGAQLRDLRGQLRRSLRVLASGDGDNDGEDDQARLPLNVSFREFVSARRELAALREENRELLARAAAGQRRRLRRLASEGERSGDRLSLSQSMD